MKIMVCGAGTEMAAVTAIIERQMGCQDVIFVTPGDYSVASSLGQPEPIPFHAPMIIDVVNNGVAKSGKQLRRERRAKERKK